MQILVIWKGGECTEFVNLSFFTNYLAPSSPLPHQPDEYILYTGWCVPEARYVENRKHIHAPHVTPHAPTSTQPLHAQKSVFSLPSRQLNVFKVRVQYVFYLYVSCHFQQNNLAYIHCQIKKSECGPHVKKSRGGG